MTITPDTKDWTWVLNQPCPECGFNAQAFAREEVPPLLLANLAAWRTALAEGADLAQRPRPDKWSTVEYGCHVRDVFRLFEYRLHLMLTQEDPAFPNWDQDVTAVVERYAEQDAAEVADDLVAAGTQLANAFASVQGGQWERTGRRGDGANFTVESFARYFLHDPVHHLWDVS